MTALMALLLGDRKVLLVITWKMKGQVLILIIEILELGLAPIMAKIQQA